MKKALKTSMHLSSNGLAMVTEMSSMLTDLQIPGISRRLLELPVVVGHDDYPEWASPGSRRLLAASPASIKPNAVVAKDGSGKYSTIQDALDKVPKKRKGVYVIYIKQGVYKEYITVNKTMTKLMFIGDGPTKTIITGNKNFVDGIPTFKTATVGAFQFSLNNFKMF